MNRCDWAMKSPALLYYHDAQWGQPVMDSKKLFAALCLEIFQAGLSWDTVLKYRLGLETVLMHLDYQQLAKCNEQDIAEWMKDDRIIRNQAKLEAIVHNAQALDSCNESFTELVWQPVNYVTVDHHLKESMAELDYTEFVKPFVNNFKQLGFIRVGDKTVYSFLQAVGVVNDHLESCTFR
ncbi:DNA-3-methyladenine glycosylase I [Lentilactobacillus senioris]|uniref:DNA-3-methyladenine glycosylase I n=1 Tax=Lentilactobacillus senioris TaxID=931534 RepID=UPI0022810891|nr:DNA-3-methyladenine glycosylase I [Lentilactobacillus senioris]MCY9807286.1 DNA-3-methyladenine glycosylase I [Lentilactobacillus senioris]